MYAFKHHVLCISVSFCVNYMLHSLSVQLISTPWPNCFIILYSTSRASSARPTSFHEPCCSLLQSRCIFSYKMKQELGFTFAPFLLSPSVFARNSDSISPFVLKSSQFPLCPGLRKPENFKQNLTWCRTLKQSNRCFFDGPVFSNNVNFQMFVPVNTTQTSLIPTSVH